MQQIPPEFASLTGPRQIVLVTSRGSVRKPMRTEADEQDDMTTVGWHMPCNLLHYAIALDSSSFSHQLISQSQVFVVNFIPEEMKSIADVCGTASGRALDKFAELKLAKEESLKIDCPRLRDSSAYMECHVISRVECGEYTVFIGKILNRSIKDDRKRLIAP